MTTEGHLPTYRHTIRHRNASTHRLISEVTAVPTAPGVLTQSINLDAECSSTKAVLTKENNCLPLSKSELKKDNAIYLELFQYCFAFVKSFYSMNFCWLGT